MKKDVKSCFLFIFITCLGFGQNLESKSDKRDIIDISYDARKGIMLNDKPPYVVSQNGYIIFEIKDINLFRYSVTLTELQNNIINSTKLSEGNTQVSIDPTVFNLTDLNLNIQVVPVVPSDETKALVDLEKEKTDIKKKIEKKKTEIQNAESEYLNSLTRVEKFNKIEEELIELRSELSLLTGIDEKERDKAQKKNEIERNISRKTTEKEILNFNNKIDNDNTTIEDYLETLKNKLESELDTLNIKLSDAEHNYRKKVLDSKSQNTQFKNFNTSLEAYSVALRRLNELTDFYQRLVSLLYSDKPYAEIRTDKTKIAYDVTEIENASKDDILKFSYDRLRDIEKKYMELTVAYSYIPTKAAAQDAKEIFDKLSAFNAQIKPSSYHTFFMQLAKVYDAINESNFTLKFQTLILSDNADLINFNLSAQPHSNLPTSVETKPINFKYDVKIKGGVKIDVSTGVFWNFGLNDKTYRFESQDDSSTLVVEEDNENLFTPSFGVLFHVYKRTSKDIKFGGNIGFSTNAERLNYYLGASVLIGKSERINLNFGLAGSQVDRVSDLYDTSETIQVPIADLPNEVPLRNPSPFKLGGFFGVTFNLIGSKNKETLSQISKL